MPLTPIEIKNKTFSRAFNGYNRSQVKAFLSVIAKEIEDLRNEKATLLQKIDELTIKIENFEKNEKLLKDTLLTAQKATADIKDNARKEAELIVSKAKMDAENIIKEANERLKKIQDKVNELESQKLNIVSQIKSLMNNISMLIEKNTTPK